MRKRTRIIILCTTLILITSTVIITGCTEKKDGQGTIGVVVTLVPQVEMAKAIGGDLVEVTVMVPVGESPHSYAPIPSQLVAVAEAEVYFKVGSGVEFEKNHMNALIEVNRDMEIVDCSDGINFLKMGEEHEHDEHNEETGDDHEYEEGDDPHVWLSPSNAKQMVNNMCGGLVKADPDNRATYESNRDAYLKRLDELVSDVHGKLDSHADKEFLVYHPAWGYFAHEFDIRQISIEDEGKEPGPAGVSAIIEQAKEHNVTVVFVSPQFDTSSAEAIASEIGGEVVMVNPLAENYIDNILDVATKMEKGLV